MRKLVVFIMLTLSGYCTMAQHTTDIGVQLAAATYWGDIERVNYSKSITPVVGVLGRYNFNKRLAIRGQLFTGNLKAEGFFENANIGTYGTLVRGSTSTPEMYPKNTEYAYSFNRAFQSVEALFEFNFRNYKLGSTKKEMFTPFVEVGIGGFFSRASRLGSVILEPQVNIPAAPAATPPIPADLYIPYLDVDGRKTNNSDVLTLTIPVGAGIKFNITKRLGGIVEVIVRKTFADNIDNLDDPKRYKFDATEVPLPEPFASNRYADKTSGMQLNNNDWYATLAVSLCYQLWSSKGNCTIYDKIKN